MMFSQVKRMHIKNFEFRLEKVYTHSYRKKINYHIPGILFCKANKLEVLTSIIKQFFYTNLYIFKKKTGLRIRWNVKLLVIKSFY